MLPDTNTTKQNNVDTRSTVGGGIFLPSLPRDVFLDVVALLSPGELAIPEVAEQPYRTPERGSSEQGARSSQLNN